MSLRYDRTGDTCTSGPQPGTKVLRKAAMHRFPRLTDVGIFHCRPVSGGTYLSTHGEGRGWDAGTPAKRDGDDLVAVLIAEADALSVQEVIWWARRWTVEDSKWHAYHGPDDHKTHVHCAQNWDGASWLTDKQAAAAFAATTPEEPDMPLNQADLDAIKALIRAEVATVNERLDGTGAATDDAVRPQLRRIEQAVNTGGGGGPTPDAVIDKLKERL